ncbi:Cytochrome c biogenesis protein TlpA [Flavobacterium sp. TAB 87]|nr:Cytochrome c biogenesis protein TlpA [Flavobacterium sp. TAB 87]
MESLKGKSVYIELWATWCSPYIKEIPCLQKLEKQYKDKNIAFVSISIDTLKDQEKGFFIIQDVKMLFLNKH